MAEGMMAPRWLRLVRESDPTAPDPVHARGPADVYAHLRPRCAGELVEVFYVLLLDARNRVTDTHELSRGTLTASLVHPREVFRVAMLGGAASIILAHNHPSDDPTPSPDDQAVTHQLDRAEPQLIDPAAIERRAAEGVGMPLCRA